MSTATALRAEAVAADDLAHRIDAEARALPDLLDGVAGRIGMDVWRGPAADDFAADLRRWRARLEAEASTLLAVANRLRLRGDQLRLDASRAEAAAAAAERAERAERALARTGGGIG